MRSSTEPTMKKHTLLFLALVACVTAPHASTYSFRHVVRGLTAAQPDTPPAAPAPELSLAATSLTLSSTLKGQAAPNQALVVSNTGTAPLTVALSALGGANAADFWVTGCPAPVPAKDSCTLTFGFTPTGLASESASLTVTDTASGTARTVSLSGLNTGPVDSYLDKVTFLARMDDNAFTDDKGNPVTNTGSVTWNSTGGVGGSGAAALSGSNRLSATSPTAFTFGTGDFTVEASVYYTTAPGTSGSCANAIGDGNLWQLCSSPTYIGWWNAAVGATRTWSYNFSTSTWYAFAISRTAGLIRVYVNGALVGSVADSTNMSATGLISIGNVIALGQPVKGLVDDVRITKGVGRFTGNSYTVTPFPKQ